MDNNGKSITFCVPTTGKKNIQLSYKLKRIAYGYNTATWSHSTDGENFTTDTTVTCNEVPSNDAYITDPFTIDFSHATELNNQPLIYIRLTVDGATLNSSNNQNNGNNRYDDINITGESNVPMAMQPVLSVGAGAHCGPFDVTITSETENASIYYTIDGSTPDSIHGTLYSTPIHIDTVTTLSAIAYAEGVDASLITTASYTFHPEIATISDFKALNGTGSTYKLTCPVTAVFQSGDYLFVEDENHTGLCIYKQGGLTSNFVNGDVITGGICGTRGNFHDLIEIKNPTFVNPTPTSGTPIEPVTVSMATLNALWNTYDSRLVKIDNVTFEQGTFGSNTLQIYQANDSINCANTFNNLSGQAPTGAVNVIGFAIKNNSKCIAPRNNSDIVDLNPSVSIVKPTENQIFELGDTISVDLEYSNFNFENGSMIEGKLFYNNTPVITRYLHNAIELSIFEQMNLTTIAQMPFGQYMITASLVNADSTQFAVPAMDSVHFTYRNITVAIETSESSLAFEAIGESHIFTVTASHLTEAITLAVDDTTFTVSPATLPANANNDTVTVTFNGHAAANGILTLTSGTVTATLTLTAVIPIDEVIYATGFENSEGFSASQNYDNDNHHYFGPEGQQWGTIHGTVTTTGAMVGQQSMQMRYYANNTHIGHIGYAFTDFDLHNVTKVEFDAKSTGGTTHQNDLKLRVSFSHDGGNTFVGDSIYEPTMSGQRHTYFVSDSGQYNNVRLKFEVVLPLDTPNNTVRLTIDAVEVYGVSGIENNQVEMPVIAPTSGTYMNPFNASITCATEGATIYYTLDGTTPDTASLLYVDTIAIRIDTTCTLKAKAFKDGMDPSNVATATYNFPVTVANIAAFKAAGAADRTATYMITGDVTFVYRNARRIFIEDATGGLLVYDNSTSVITGTYNEGDVIHGGVVGTYTVYNGMQELVPTADWAAASGTATVTPVVATTAAIANDFATYEARLVRVNAGTFDEDVTFTTANYSDGTLTDATGDILVRNQFKTLDTTINAGDTVDVIGLLSVYVSGGDTTYQIFPRTNADIIAFVADTTDPGDTIIGIHTVEIVTLTVYPNPTMAEITVTTDRDGGSLEVLNAFGQVVYRSTNPVYPMTVNLSDKAAGLYFVRVITDDQRIAIVKVSKK